MNEQEQKECQPPKCNRYVEMNGEKFSDCCDGRFCRYEIRSILECICSDVAYGSGQRNRERAKEAIALLPRLMASQPKPTTIAVLKQAAEVLNPFRAGTIHKWNPKTKEVMLLEISLRELSSLHTAITEELKRLGEV